MTAPQSTELQVTVRGHGEPLLRIHGSLSGDPELDDWHAQSALAHAYELRMVACRGYFTSPDPPHSAMALTRSPMSWLRSSLRACTWSASPMAAFSPYLSRPSGQTRSTRSR